MVVLTAPLPFAHPGGLIPTSGAPAEAVQTAGASAARWFDAVVTPAWQIALTIAIGMLTIALVRRFIARGVRQLVDGAPVVRRHAGRLLARGRRGAVDGLDLSPLAAARRTQRTQTMGSALSSAATFLVGAVVVVVVLGLLGVNLGPLLASAGVAGVALGFGSRTLIQDFLAGISMLAEDQYGVGDVVDVGEASGVVEQVGLRVTQIRSLNGTLWYVRNGAMLRVGNFTHGWSRALVEVRVLADQDVPRVRELLLAAAADVGADPDLGAAVQGEGEVAGIEDLTADGAMLRLLVKTAPSRQWDVARAVRARIQVSLARESIELALPGRELLVHRTRTPALAPRAQPPQPVHH
jgi:small-conductance mechanosensitive channel